MGESPREEKGKEKKKEPVQVRIMARSGSQRKKAQSDH